MRVLIESAMATAMALCVVAEVLALGGVTPDLSIYAFGLAMLLALAWVGKLFFAKAVSWKQSPLHIPVLAFFVYAVARYFTTPLEYDARIEVLNIGLFTLIYFLCAANFYRSRDRYILLGTLMALVLFEAIYGCWQFWTKADVVMGFVRPRQYHARASGSYICPNHYAGLLEMIAALLIARLALWAPSKAAMQRLALYKVFIGYCAVMAFMGLVLSLSRAGWIAMVVALFSFLLWGEWERGRVLPRLFAGTLAIAIIIFAAFYIAPVRLYLFKTFNERSESKSIALSDTSIGGRTVMWQDTLQMIQQHPITGFGAATWQWYHPRYQSKEMQGYAEFAHNDVLNAASDYGLIGAALVLFGIISFFRHATVFVPSGNNSDRRSFAVGTGVALTAILIHSWFDFNLHIPGNALLLTTLMGFTVAMEDQRNRFRRVELGRPRRVVLAGVLIVAVLGGGGVAGRTALAAYYHNRGDNAKVYLYWDKALAAYRTAIRIDPKFPTPHFKIGEVYRTQSFWRKDPLRKGEREQLARLAIDAYQQSLKLNPRQVQAVVSMAKAYELAGDAVNAQRAFKEAIALSPTSAYLYQELGIFYRDHGDTNSAVTALEKSIELHWQPPAAVSLQELKGQ